MQKVLIFYASYGGGHFSAAKSIKKYIDENYEDVKTEMVDCMKYINKPLEKVTTGAYREMAKKAPKLWGKVYSKSEKGILSEVSKDSNKLMARKLNKLIQDINPDLIISTHPFSSQMASYLKRKEKINCEIATILTDFAIHKQWLIGNEYTNNFFVSNENMKQDMIELGIGENKVHVTGIPMSDRFFENFDKEKIYKMFNLSMDKKVILFFGGGEFGLGKDRTVQILKAFIKKVSNYQIVAVAGKNEKMKEAFEELVKDNKAEDRVRVLGFTDKVPELMNISSLVVTKPGGLTTTESLASELPMIIINPIPGQEEENAEFIESKGVGVWIRSKDKPEEVINSIFSDEAKLEEMRKNARLLSKKNSTKEICNTLLA